MLFVHAMGTYRGNIVVRNFCVTAYVMHSVSYSLRYFFYYVIFILQNFYLSNKICGILYCIYIYMYVESLANKFLILRGLTRSKVTLLFNILYCILCFFFIFVLFLHSITTCVLYSILFSR